MKLIRLFFSENSDISIMRILSFISLMIAGYLAISGQDASVPTFVYAAFGGKAVQKYIEAKEESKPKT